MDQSSSLQVQARAETIKPSNQNRFLVRQANAFPHVTAIGTAAALGCLLALPAFADTAAQGVEGIAKQLSSSDGVMGKHAPLTRTILLFSPGQAISYTTGSLGTQAFREGLVSGFLLILFSELGDKTFFIAVLLALKKNKFLVFAGTFGALAIMTVISVSSTMYGFYGFAALYRP